MGVQVIDDEVSLFGRRIGGDGPADVVRKVGFGARRTIRRGHDLTGGDVEVEHERQCAVPDVLELPALDLAGR